MTRQLFQNGVLYRPKEIYKPGGPVPVAPSAFWADIRRTGLPPPVKIGPRTTAFFGDDLNAKFGGLADEK